MDERRYESQGHDVVVRESDRAVELEVDGVPIEVEYLDGVYHSQTAHSFRSFPTVDALVEELLRNEGRLWSLHGDVRRSTPPTHHHGAQPMSGGGQMGHVGHEHGGASR